MIEGAAGHSVELRGMRPPLEPFRYARGRVGHRDVFKHGPEFSPLRLPRPEGSYEGISIKRGAAMIFPV